MNDDKVNVKCCLCGNDIYLSPNTYRKNKNNNKKYKCKKCLAEESKERYNNLPLEEKERRANISKERMKSYWKNIPSDEKNVRLNKLNNGFNEYQSNLSNADKEEISKKLSNSQKQRWKNISDEHKQEIIKPMHDGFKNWYDNLTDEEKLKHHEYVQNGNKRWWDNLSEDEYLKFSQLRSEASKNYWNNISDEERKNISDRQSKSTKKFWDNMDEESYQEWDLKRAKGFNNYLNNLNTFINKNEMTLSNYLNIHHLKFEFHWYNKTKHPEFNTIFPINNITGSKFISPYHQWDFVIHTKDGDVLVDIDGSIHDPSKINHEITYFNGNKIKLSEIISFNDSQRPYQTDGFPAYAILCYDDKLTKDTPVLNIKTNEKMSFESFMYLLEWMNLTDKEKRELIQVSEIV